jgi:hypothetical protein
MNYSTIGEVEKSTGKFGLYIPFHSIENDYIEIPIGLQYRTSGVKVNEVASEVGINWNFTGNASIIRELRGVPDEVDRDPCCASNGNITSDQSYPGNYWSISWRDGNRNGSAQVYPKFLLNSEKFMGSATWTKVNYYLRYFPFVKAVGGAGPNSTTINEVEALYYHMSEGDFFKKYDTERDIFHFSVGKLNFSFALRIKSSLPVDNISCDNGTCQEECCFEFIPLDEKGIKIEHQLGYINIYKRWSDDQTQRIRDVQVRTITKFIVTDKSGVKYIFDKYVISDNESLTGLIASNYGTNYDDQYFQFTIDDSYISEWKLSEIQFPNNNDKVKYTYSQNNTKIKHEIPVTHAGAFKGFYRNLYPFRFNKQGEIKYTYNSTEGWRLQGIDYVRNNKSLYSIFIHYGENRNDYERGTHNLTQLFLLNCRSEEFDDVNIIRTFTLNKYWSKVYGETTSRNDKRATRMFLANINDSKDEFSYKFEYDNPDNMPVGTHYMNADIFGFPGRVNKSLPSDIDVYPYFPNFYILLQGHSGQRIKYYKDDTIESGSYSFPGTNRFPDITKTKLGTLKGINFPTGGRLEINYENNTYYVISEFGNPNELGPGVRVSKLKYYDGTKVEKEIVYSYNTFSQNASSGKLLYKPSYAYFVNKAWDNQRERLYVLPDNDHPAPDGDHRIRSEKEYFDRGFDDKDRSLKLVMVSTHPLGPTQDKFGNEIIYENVEERQIFSDNDNNGYVRYYNYYSDKYKVQVNVAGGPTDEFTYTQSATKNTVFFYTGSSPWYNLRVMYGQIEKRGYDLYPFPHLEEYGARKYLNGKLKQINYHNSNGTLLKKINFKYSNDETPQGNSIQRIQNIKQGYILTHRYLENDQNKKIVPHDVTPTNPNDPYKYSHVYCFAAEQILFENPVQIINETETNYYNMSDSLVNKVDYTYNSKNSLITEETTVSSESKISKTTYRYPFDINTGVYKSMADANMLNSIIESTTKINNYTTNSTLFTYKINNGKFVTDKTYSLETNLPLSIFHDFNGTKDVNYGINPEIEYLSYDITGNINEMKDRTEIYTSYLWSYNYQYPIAEIKGVPFADIQAALGGSTVISTFAALANPSKDEIKLFLTPLYSNDKTKKAIITPYSYRSLIGLETKTEPNGLISRYEYDNSGRLKTIKDHPGNVLKSYDYYYNKYLPAENFPPLTAKVNVLNRICDTELDNRATVTITGGSGSFEYNWYIKNTSGTILASKTIIGSPIYFFGHLNQDYLS